jgi:hypothetical protein
MTTFPLFLAAALVLCFAFGGLVRAAAPGLAMRAAARDLARGEAAIRREGLRWGAGGVAALLALSVLLAMTRG